MFVLQTYAVAVAFCVITMLCWGSWANTQKLAGRRWRFELFYWDYVLGMLLMALIFAFTLGSMGQSGRGFLADVRQADPHNLGSAFFGGVVFNAANILLVAAIAIAGMSVAFPVGIGLALVLGVLINYLTAPKGEPVQLFLGVGFIAAAIVLDALAYRKLSAPSKGGGVKGLVLAVLCGILMANFYRFVQVAMPDAKPENFLHMPAGKLTPYTAMVFFSLGVLASNLRLQHADHDQALHRHAGRAGRVLPRLRTGSPLGHRGRNDLVRGNDFQHHRAGCDRRGDLLRPGPGGHDGRRAVGRLHLARIPRRPPGHVSAAGADAGRLRDRVGVDRSFRRLLRACKTIS